MHQLRAIKAPAEIDLIRRRSDPFLSRPPVPERRPHAGGRAHRPPGIGDTDIDERRRTIGGDQGGIAEDFGQSLDRDRGHRRNRHGLRARPPAPARAAEAWS